jgi:DNA-binding transcriptional ArsR family regulator
MTAETGGVRKPVPLLAGPARHELISTLRLTTGQRERIVPFNHKVEEDGVAAQAIVTVFSALADETRLDIVNRLAKGDATLSELAEHYDMSIQAVSKHLSVLEDAGVVSRRREAQRRPARLGTAPFDLMEKWIERCRQNLEARYQRLDQLLAQLDEQTPDDREGATT